VLLSILKTEEGKNLSDQKLSDKLAEKGINIARRTVAKYRKELNFDSSYDR
jgi:RNA polymerase sigma-54 factor